MSEPPPETATRRGAGRRLFRNTLANALGTVLTLGISVALVPFMLGHLGAPTYGVVVLALTFSGAGGYIALADFGLQTSVVKAVADAEGADQVRTASSVVSTAVAFFAIVGGLVIAALTLLAIVSVGLLQVPQAAIADLRVLLLLLAAEGLVALPGLALRAVLEGTQRYGLAAAVSTGRAVLYAVGVVWALLAGHGMIAIGVATAGATVVATVVYALLAMRTMPGLRVSRALATRRQLRELLAFGRWVFLGRVNAVVFQQTDKIVLAAVATTAALARYDIAYRIFAAAVLIDALSVSAVMPATAALQAAGERERLVELLLRGTRYAMMVTLPFVIGAIILAEPLITHWVGGEYTDVALPTRLLLGTVIVSTSASVANIMLIGAGRVREATLYASLAIVINVVLSIALAPRFGLLGVVIGTVVAFLITCPLYIRRLLLDLRVPLGRFLRATAGPTLPWLGLFALLVVGARQVVEPTNLLVVVLLCVPAAALYASGVLVSMGRDERRVLVSLLTPSR